MQGVFINGSRPKFKKDVKEYIDGVNLWEEHGGDPEVESVFPDVRDPYGLVIEATSMFGNEFDGSLAEAVRTGHHGPFYIVGPDPHTKRNWYLNLRYSNDKGWRVE